MRSEIKSGAAGQKESFHARALMLSSKKNQTARPVAICYHSLTMKMHGLDVNSSAKEIQAGRRLRNLVTLRLGHMFQHKSLPLAGALKSTSNASTAIRLLME